MDKRTVRVLVLACLGLLLAAGLALRLGAVPLWQAPAAARRILLFVRVPRLLAAALAGAALSAAGLIIQTVLANPLAGPSILGINAGAGLFAAAAMALLPAALFPVPLAAFAGALCSILLVFAVARTTGASRITIVLAGVAISSLMTAGLHTLNVLFPEVLAQLRDFQTGGFAGVAQKQLLPAGILIGLGLAAALLFAGELDILGLGEETAGALGLHVKRWRLLFLALAAALAGAAVSFAGLVSFVGLIVPHAVRLLARGGGKRLHLALCALLGAAFLILCDTAARTFFAPYELPVGILIAYLGAPFFLWLLLRNKRARHA
ncbi:MAG: iron ABC transporter permease [Oscillospiraceae bacterium]|jgi:iron complex transport system permease protein|nr:iron ABC transporter permease [Oscillospiraceae bacterium]